MNNSIAADVKAVMRQEAAAITCLPDQVTDSYVDAIQLLSKATGKVVVSGVGKSGLIGRKIAASLSSLGTPAFFIESTESLHGDLGMITNQDVVLLLSNSGKTAEVLAMLPSLKAIGCPIIALTAHETSHLAKQADIVISYTYQHEADHLQLAPTTSAMVMLAIGDAMAATLAKQKHFTAKDFHRYHPGGSLGAQLATDPH